MQKKSESKYRQTRIQAIKCDYQGKKFDSIAEKEFYLLLEQHLPSKQVEILRPYNIPLPGKARKWRCDFALKVDSNDTRAMDRLDNLRYLFKSSNVPPSIYDCTELDLSYLYIEYKGTTDLEEGLTEFGSKIARLDKNFINRINWASTYAPWILDNLVCVGAGSGGVVSYRQDGSYCVTPVINVEFAKRMLAKW